VAGVDTNAGSLASQYARRAAAFEPAVTTGLRNAAIQVDQKQVKNLSGGGAPGSWPVPARTGYLRRASYWRMRGDRLAVVGNSARYAKAVHDGRPYLDFAVQDVDVITHIRKQTRKALK